MKILLSGGGTGGHVYPALALMRRIQELNPTAEFLYVGTEKGLENRIVKEYGIPFASVEIKGFKRSLSLDTFKTIRMFISSINQAKQIVKKFQPDIVIGTGGYVCAPIVYAASKLGVPSIIHEQNSVAGITNKFLARYVTKIAICFEEVRNDFSKYPKKVCFTGNPRAQEVSNVQKKAALEEYNLDSEKPTVLIFGGSRGAKRINDAFVEALPLLANKNYQVLMATGDIHFETIQSQLTKIKNEKFNVSVVSYIPNMPEVFSTVSLVVSRSGATTLAELTALGLPSVLIPSPYVTNDHQTKNAESLVNKNAAKLINESELTGEKLVQTLDELMLNTNMRQEMAKNAKKMGMPDASDRIIELINEIVKK
ncbi:undecaprenyldiphospho-muramoylpentapeptide beta-N-acetylglucosaminyltransferase [Carnobacterium sp. 17-4]|uniref:undecaprenyldiphospho-muramoylpentapeptide beta-N-acetylglucosaminyltransferase n=1 Tax=Carnobacterium sp. (strain 17-4) TaxID=208596 RepID=UPI0002058ADA|nr:undecaprenyldiphospho-muramoylpentapeptide beta-N-acetylglucosaminyltransferase [Carnobacterium sp. 17-4]AEB29496.1 undecaprenyldiphospho-muramoylpentapeptide beta-N-acetylglucosaminyltransferase [Carnobacterium sp. 17-4]